MNNKIYTLKEWSHNTIFVDKASKGKIGWKIESCERTLKCVNLVFKKNIILLPVSFINNYIPYKTRTVSDLTE